MSIPQPYVNSDKNSFANTSLLKRWPAIVDGIIADLLRASSTALPARQGETEKLINQINKLKTSMANNDKIEPLPSTLSDAEVYNSTRDISRGARWEEASWLTSECALYRKLHAIFQESENWKSYDMFELTKNETFQKSADAVSSLAKRYHVITQQLQTAEGGKLEKAALEVLFHEIISTSLWGNATDLSLLVTVTLEELKKLQVAAENRDKESLLTNDFGNVWKQLNSQIGGRVDIVLDNSGFELYTDLVLALFLLDNDLAEQIVLHPKNQGWFVSDVVPKDFGAVLSLLGDANKFPKERADIDFLTAQVLKYTNEGQLLIRTSPFWTSPLPFWEIKQNGAGGGDRVWRDLRQSKLVIFKGDLNYRKLTGDVMWPRDTPFKTAILDLATSDIPFVTLRTVKADVCVGLPSGKAEELASNWSRTHPDQHPEGWAWSGNYAVVNFHR